MTKRVLTALALVAAAMIAAVALGTAPASAAGHVQARTGRCGANRDCVVIF